MGVDARRVAQLLKLCNLAPEIVDAFEAGGFGLDTAQAFTLTDDHDRQREALAACDDWVNAGRVRQLLRTGMTSPRERLTRFVGREAYGGAVLVDLFAGDGDDETWTDRGLVERLAAEKLEAAVAEVKAEGWDWVTVVDPCDYGFSHGYRRLTGDPVPLTDDEQAAYDETVAFLENEGFDPDACDSAGARIAELDAKSERGELGPDRRASAGVFVQDIGASASASAKTAAATDPALHGWGRHRLPAHDPRRDRGRAPCPARQPGGRLRHPGREPCLAPDRRRGRASPAARTQGRQPVRYPEGCAPR
jgi:hypothetical protein